jgi:hypothetical protein
MQRQIIFRTTLPPQNNEVTCIGRYYEYKEDLENDGPDEEENIYEKEGLIFEDYDPKCNAVAIYHDDQATIPWSMVQWYWVGEVIAGYWKDTEEEPLRQISLPSTVYMILSKEAYDKQSTNWIISSRIRAGIYKYE